MLQHKRSLALVTTLFTLIVICACIPPPAQSIPSSTPAPEGFDLPRCILDSVAGVTLSALPTPNAQVAAASFLGSAMGRMYCGLPTVAANSRPRDEAPRQMPPWVRARMVAASGDALADSARAYTGVRYRYAGMSSRGMDCSGLIARVLQSHGIRAPHNSAQLSRLGRAVRVAELKPGDLLFFRTGGRGISHVGMYIGNDRFVHASSGAGRVVTTSIHDPYYTKRYRGARRLGEG